MKIAVTVLAFAEIFALLAAAVALLFLAIRKLVRTLRNFVRPEQGLGSKGGGASVHARLAQLGMHVSKEDALKIAAAVQAQLLDNKPMLTHAEFRDLARDAVKRAAA